MIELIQPRIREIKCTDREGTFCIEPLERGYGTTLGNSLRRVLLSSITGAAVVYLKIEGILHEFSYIEGVVEDTTEIILNLKKLPLKLTVAEPDPLYISTKGEKEVKAGDIQLSEGVEILNPDYHIATINEPGKDLEMEIGARMGRGYVPAEMHTDVVDEEGIILVDSNFSPIIKVNYKVTPSRVGQRSDYDRLEIFIETDGSVRPNHALSQAAQILADYISLFIGFDQKMIEERKKEEEEKAALDKNLKKTIDELDLSVRSHNCLKSEGVLTVEDIISKSEPELMGLRNFGEKSLNEIREKLTELGLSLKSDEEDKKDKKRKKKK